jgi:hypothetical protein
MAIRPYYEPNLIYYFRQALLINNTLYKLFMADRPGITSAHHPLPKPEKNFLDIFLWHM